eukprot:gene16940-23214_t
MSYASMIELEAPSPLAFTRFSLAFAGVESAFDEYGTVFPYCYCGETCGPLMTDYEMTEKNISFVIRSNPECPMWSSDTCTMDIAKVEINTFTACRFSTVYGYKNGVRTRLSFDSSGFEGVQMMKLNQIGMDLSDLASGELLITIEIPSDARTGGTRCLTSKSLLNTTDGAPIIGRELRTPSLVANGALETSQITHGIQFLMWDTVWILIRLLPLTARLAPTAISPQSTVFPYCYCGEECGPIMTDFVTKEKTISFTIKSNPACPMWADNKCSMDIGKIEINSFTACRFSEVYAYKNGNMTRLSFDSSGFEGVQMIKLNQIGMSLSDLTTGDLAITIEIPENARTGGTRCLTSDALLNTTDGGPMSVAVFSSNLNPQGA